MPGSGNSAVRKCVVCNRKKQRHLYYASEWKKKKPQVKCKSCMKKEPAHDAKRDAYLRAHYDIALSEYQEILGEQDGRCYICRRKPGARSLSVDHDHAVSDKRASIRGLLCTKCNRYLGHLEDSVEAAFRLMDYLDRPGWIDRKER